MIPQYTLVIAW